MTDFDWDSALEVSNSEFARRLNAVLEPPKPVVPKFVSIESPYNSLYPWTLVRNIQYAIMSTAHATRSGDVCWTPHICNTQHVRCGFSGYVGDTMSVIAQAVLGDGGFGTSREFVIAQTNHIRATKVDTVVCYVDFGVSSGMQSAIDTANENGVPIEYRKLPPTWRREIFGQGFKSTILPLTKGAIGTGLCLAGLKLLRMRFRT